LLSYERHSELNIGLLQSTPTMRRFWIIFLLFPNFFLTQAQDEKKCGSSEPCIDREICDEYQDDLRLLRTLPPGEKRYKLERHLANKVCDSEKRKVCCSSCPCVPESECQHVQNLRKDQGKPEVLEILRSLVCNRKERKFYCCKKDQPVTPAKLDPSDDVSFLPSAEKRECGLPKKTDLNQIIGGEKTSPGKYPYAALLGYTVESDNNNKGKKKIETKYGCGGVLINKWYVVTAAHCQNDNITSVRLGEWEVTIVNPNGTELPPVQDFIINSNMVHVHEDYKDELPFPNDIALIKLPTPAVLNEGVQMACLPMDEIFAAKSIGVDDLREGLVKKYATVVGWGFSSLAYLSGGFTTVPEKIQQKLNQQILNAAECSEKLKKSNFNPESSQICAGGEEGKDSCKGDSGGPLFIKHLAQNGQPSTDDEDPVFVIGIVSFGGYFCGKGLPAIYTRITDMMPWIMKNLV